MRGEKMTASKCAFTERVTFNSLFLYSSLKFRKSFVNRKTSTHLRIGIHQNLRGEVIMKANVVGLR